MLDRHSRLWRNVALAVLAAVVLWFAWEIRAVLNPLIVGYLLAYVLHPLAVRLERFGIGRRTAVNLVFLGGFVILAAIAFGLAAQGRELVRETAFDPEVRAQVAGEFAKLRERLEAWLVPGALGFLDELDLEFVVGWLRDFVTDIGPDTQVAAERGVSAAGTVLGILAALVGSTVAAVGFVFLVPIYTWYLLFELGQIHAFVSSYVPSAERVRFVRVASRIGEVLASFFRGRITVCFLKGGLLTIGLAALGVPYAFLFGMASGFLSIVPFFGPLVGFLAAFVVGVLDHGVVGSLWRTGLVFGLAEIVEGYFLIPKILGDSMGLHPVAVLFALLAGGVALGMFGVLIALPLTAATVILAREYLLPVLHRMAEDGEDEEEKVSSPSPRSGAGGPPRASHG